MAEIRMPQLSSSMEEALVLTWLVADGDPVNEGDELVELETDKATMTHVAEFTGRLEVVVAEGETAKVGELIARISDGEPAVEAPADEGEAVTSEPAESDVPEAAQISSDEPDTTPEAETPAIPDAGSTSIRATPLARRIAAIHGVDLNSLTGSGVGGRIVKSQVLEAAGIEIPRSPKSREPEVEVPASTVPDRPVTGAKGGGQLLEPSRLQTLIARRMSESKATIPHFQVQTEVLMDRAIEFRREIKRALDGGTAPSLNDLIVKASAIALMDHPLANGSYVDGGFVLHENINIGIAVAAEDALVVPVVADCDRKSLGEIGRASRRLAELVRSGEVTPPDLAGGTFTVSNLGMFGMTAITPVINPPQAAILGVGAIRPVLQRAADGGVEDANLLTLTLSCDHRILYGADASKFLSRIAELLADPWLLVL